MAEQQPEQLAPAYPLAPATAIRTWKIMHQHATRYVVGVSAKPRCGRHTS
jgi:hypothetical protein